MTFILFSFSIEAPSAAPGSAKASPRELITAVKKTAFDDAEAQQLIDILLNKQAGGSTSNGDWVDTGSKVSPAFIT